MWRAYYKLPKEERIKWFSKTNLQVLAEVHGECEHKIMNEADMIDAQNKLKDIEEHESGQ